MESSFDSPWDDCHVSVRKLTSLRLARDPLVVPEVEWGERRPRSSAARALIVAGESDVRRRLELPRREIGATRAGGPPSSAVSRVWI